MLTNLSLLTLTFPSPLFLQPETHHFFNIFLPAFILLYPPLSFPYNISLATFFSQPEAYCFFSFFFFSLNIFEYLFPPLLSLLSATLFLFILLFLEFSPFAPGIH